MSRALFLLAILSTVSVAAQTASVPPAMTVGEGKPRPLAFPSEKLRWIRVHSTHFDVISSASPERTTDIVANLETLAAVLKRTSARFQTAPVPTRIFIFADRAESEAWFQLLLGPGNFRLGGAYVRHKSGGTMIIDGANTRRIARTAMHELVHDLLRQGELVPPLWLEEGLAEYFSGASLKQNSVEAGATVPQHAGLLRRRQLMTLERMFAMEPETEAAAAPLFYAQSWAAVDWLMQLDSTVFYQFLEDLERGVAVAAAISRRYGKSLDALESAIRRRGRLSGTTVRFEINVLPVVPPAVDIDRATLLYQLGSFLTLIPDGESEAHRHFREAVRVDPKHGRSLVALGRFEEAIAAAPDDPEVRVAYAESRIGEEVKEANELAMAGKLGEAATLIRKQLAASRDPEYRRYLEAQAAYLEKAAFVNRHIRMYNDALAFASTNHYEDALKLLDEILKDATDAGVIEDSTRLRDELRKRR